MLERLSSAGIKLLVRRSARARRISISVKRSGEVTLIIPLRADETAALKFLESKSDWVIESVRQQMARPQSPELSIDEQNKYIRAANEYLPRRISELSAVTGLRYAGVTITGAKSRWGSCSTVGRISLSFHLMRLPKHLIDFVIIHELCHTVHHNHSAAFHALVNHHTKGREAELDRELRGYKI